MTKKKAPKVAAHQTIYVRLTGKLAQRFRAYHEQIKKSDNLELYKLGALSQADLARYAVCEWLASEESVNGTKKA